MSRIDGEHAVGNAAQDILRVLLLQGDFARQLLRAPVDLRLALLQGQEFLLLGRDITLQAPGIEELAIGNHADNRVRRPHLAAAAVHVEHFEIRDPVAGANEVDQARDLLFPGTRHVAGHGCADHFLRAFQAI